MAWLIVYITEGPSSGFLALLKILSLLSHQWHFILFYFLGGGGDCVKLLNAIGNSYLLAYFQGLWFH